MNGNGVKWHGSRREFCSAALVGLSQKSERRISGAILDQSHLAGHQLRDHAKFPTAKQQVRIPLVIVGAGISGLSAAWQLVKRGFRDFVILELEAQAGGNSRHGENETSAYPWAAHYLPVPNRNSALVREMATEFGLLHDGQFEERHLCHSPQERIFLHGRWQEGLEPELGVSREHRQQFRRFEEKMREFAQSGQFTIPIDTGAKPSPLDRISMSEWLRQNGFQSPYLDWYVNYATRDDYGSLAQDTSAWAGIHYFASREHEERGPFTWPEGNGWLVKQYMSRLSKYVQTGSMVTRIERQSKGLRVFTKQTEFLAGAVIWSAPSFVLPYVSDVSVDLSGLVYSPWLTANLTLDRMPREPHAPLAWDNVIYGSPSLGYVVATHQSLLSQIHKSVWTYYLALPSGTPAANRKMLLEKDWGHWKEFILTDLERAHPDIRECVTHIDIMRLGHAMARPVPGWIFSPQRKQLIDWGKDLVLANSDLSGLSIFEEAQHHGVRAANRMLHLLGKS